MLVRNARRYAISEPPCASPVALMEEFTSDSDASDEELRDGVAPLSNDPLDAAHSDIEDHRPINDNNASPSRRGASRLRQRRSTSAFNRSNGLVLSATYLTATYGGAPAFYSLSLGEPCTSTVVVHLQCVGDASAAAATHDTSLRLSCDRLEFTPSNFAAPQIVRVELVEPSAGTHMVLHRAFSLDSNYDRLVTPSVVVKTERSSAASLVALGGALVHKRTNAKGETMAPRHAATRTIDLVKALAPPVATSTTTVTSTIDPTASSSSLGAVPTSTTIPPLESTPVFVSLMAAGNHFSSLVAKPQGGNETLLMWGMNTSGELGIGSTTPMVEPVPLALPPQVHGEPESVVSVACGKHHAALVTTHGRLYAWGNNKYGQLGLGDYTNVDAPREVVFVGALTRTAASHQRALRLKHAMLEHGNTNVTQVACGAFHTLFVTHQQHVLSMGYNQAGQLGLGHRLQQHKGWRSCTPAMVETLRDSCILDLAAGQNHSACVLSNGDVYVWGCGSDGRLGVPLGRTDTALRQNQSECEVLPVPVLSLKDFGVRARTVRCGARHTAILSDHDLLYVWGANEFGQLGLGDKRSRTRPCLVEFPPFLNEGIVDVSLGEFHSACVTWGGDAYVWGLDLSSAQTTQLDQRCAPELIPVPAAESVLRIACGWAHTTVLTSRDSSNGTSASVTTTTSPRKAPIHVHRRKEEALKYSARQQEVAKWGRVTAAIALMGGPQRRGTIWGKARKKKKLKKMSLARVVANALTVSRQDLLGEQERERAASIEAVASAFVQTVVDEAMKRAVAMTVEKRMAKRPKSQRRPASTPGRRVKPAASSPQGVFYHNALQLFSPPTLPPPCLVPPASSPRHATLRSPTEPSGDYNCASARTSPWPSRTRPHPVRPASAMHSLRSPNSSIRQTPRVLTASYTSLLFALQHDNPRDENDEVRPPTLSSPRRSKHRNVVELLLHKPSFSLTSHLVGGNNRGVRPTRVHHTCR